MKNLILCFFTIFTINAWGQNCNFSITLAPFTVEVNPSEQSLPHEFTISRGSNSQNCRNFRAFYGKGTANSYNRKVYSGSNSIDFNIYGDSALTNVLKEYGDAGSGEFISGNLPNRNLDYHFNSYIKVVDLNSVFSNGPGYYGDLIPISFYSVRNNGTLIYQTTSYMYYQIVIPRYAELSLGEVGEGHDPNDTQHILDFGTIENNESKTARLSVKGNVGFGIYFASQNGGKLVNGQSYIDYTVKVGSNSPLNLSNPGQSYYITQRNTGTSESGQHYPVEVQLQSLSTNAQTGNYDDVITITVNAW